MKPLLAAIACLLGGCVTDAVIATGDGGHDASDAALTDGSVVDGATDARSRSDSEEHDDAGSGDDGANGSGTGNVRVEGTISAEASVSNAGTPGQFATSFNLRVSVDHGSTGTVIVTVTSSA